MIQRLNTLYSKLANAKPGERFINYYRYQKTKEGEGHWSGSFTPLIRNLPLEYRLMGY